MGLLTKLKGISQKSIIIDKSKPDFEIEGHKFYVLNPWITDEANPIKLSDERALYFALALNDLGIMIKEPELKTFADKVIDLAMDGKKNSEIVFMARMLKERLELKSNLDIYMNLAKHIILVDDEPNELPSEKYNQIKEDLIKLPSVKGFFLRQALASLKSLQNSADDTQTEDYLLSPEVAEIDRMFKDSILNTTSMGALMNSMSGKAEVTK